MNGQATGAGEGPLSPDRALLAELERWRSAIARNAALRNPVLTSWELNAFVHGIINRVLYLRICEDRGLLPSGTLGELAPAEAISERISGLFHDAEGTSPLALLACTRGEERAPSAREPVLDDRVLRGFVETLSSPLIPCDFSVFPLIRLAGVCRVFFRKEIRLMGGHRAVLEETAAAKGAGGFPPPPEAAREYLVAHAWEEKAEGGREDDPARLRVLDPTCGSGHLLLLSYRHLMNRHGQRLREAGAGVDGVSPRGLSLEERFRILGVLFGVDPDPRAVEVTRILLLVMALEGAEGPEGLRSGLDLLPVCHVLGRNIRCGNAVIGPDYLEETFPRPSPRRVREQGIPMDWAGVFPEVMGSGGFGVVVVEPPTHHPGTEQGLRRHLQQHYRAYHDDADMAIYLMERGISLVSRDGTFASLTPDRWLRARHGGPLRRLLSTLQMEEMVLLQGPEGAGGTTTGTGHCILRVTPRPASHGIRVIRMDPVALAAMSASRVPGSRLVDPASLGDGGWTFTPRDSRELMDRLKMACTPLGRYVVGTLPCGDPALHADHALVDRKTRDKLIHGDGMNPGEFRPVVTADQVCRYAPVEPAWYLPVKSRPESPLEEGGARESPPPATAAILCTERGGAPVCTLATSGALAGEGVIVIPRRDLYLLGLINSTLSRFLFREEGAMLSVRSLERFPVSIPDFSDPADSARHDRMVALVSRMLDLHRMIQESIRDHEKVLIQRQIETTDMQVDDLVYELYGLTDEERRVVEEATGE
jgi:SAM-dependent methyltransferase